MNFVAWGCSAALLVLATLAVQPVPAPGVSDDKVKAALPELERLAQQTLKKTGVPGMAIAVVFKDKVVYRKGFGVRKADEAGPVDAETVFLLASVSKPI